MKNGLYPKDLEERYEIEKLGEICTVDCLFPDIGYHLAKDKLAWGVQRSKEIIPKSLMLLNKNCKENIEKTGFASTGKLSMGDVYLLHWLSTVIYNPYYVEENSKYMEKYPVLKGYWEKNRTLMADYLDNRRTK